MKLQPPSYPAGTSTVSRRSGTASAHQGRSRVKPLGLATTSVPSCIRTPLSGSFAAIEANSS